MPASLASGTARIPVVDFGSWRTRRGYENNARRETMSPHRKSRIKLFRNPLTALALLYAVVLLGCASEGTTRILSYHGFLWAGGPSSGRHPGVDLAALGGG